MSTTPLYEVINRDLAQQIAAGSRKPGERLDSESDLAQHYGVSRMTVRQALGELERNGLVVRRHGLGTFVSEARAPGRRASRLGSFEEELGLDKGAVTTRVIAQEVVVPPDDVRALLSLGKRQKSVRIYRLRLLGDLAVALQESWIPFLSAPALARCGLVGGSLYATLRERCGIEIDTAEQRVTAAIADAEKADLLGIEAGGPLISISRICYDTGGEVVEIAESVTIPAYPIIIHLERGETGSS